jgi:hypothetical protein
MRRIADGVVVGFDVFWQGIVGLDIHTRMHGQGVGDKIWAVSTIQAQVQAI